MNLWRWTALHQMNYEVQDLRFYFNTAEIGRVSELRGYELSGVNSMLFKWTEFEARKK